MKGLDGAPGKPGSAGLPGLPGDDVSCSPRIYIYCLFEFYSTDIPSNVWGSSFRCVGVCVRWGGEWSQQIGQKS